MLLALTFLPLPLAYKFAENLGKQQFRAASSSLSNKIMTTIKLRLGVGSEVAEDLTKLLFQRSAMEKLEGGVFRFKSKKRIGTLLHIHNLERLDQALEKGHGCILYAGHFHGRWTCFAN